MPWSQCRFCVSPAPSLAKTSKRTLKTLRNLLTGRHGNIIRSVPNTLLASGLEIPRKVCLSAWAVAKAVAELESQPNLSFPTAWTPLLDQPLAQSLLQLVGSCAIDTMRVFISFRLEKKCYVCKSVFLLIAFNYIDKSVIMHYYKLLQLLNVVQYLFETSVQPFCSFGYFFIKWHRLHEILVSKILSNLAYFKMCRN